MDRATAEALLGAAAAGDASELESVLSSEQLGDGESVDVVGESGRTPLHLAASNHASAKVAAALLPILPRHEA